MNKSDQKVRKLMNFDLSRSLPVHTNLRASFRVYILICVTDAWNVKMNHSDIIASSEIRPGNLFPPGYASQEEMWNAVQNRKELRDSSFVFAVRSTGIYCRPSCPARRPSRKNVVFFKEALDAEKNGYRPCLRCKPENAIPQETEIVRKLCAYMARTVIQISHYLIQPLGKFIIIFPNFSIRVLVS